MPRSFQRLVPICVGVFALLWMSAAARAQNSPPGGVAETAPVPANQIPKYVSDAVNSPGRPAADRALDAGRQPAQILTFFGIKPGMQVADIFAGGGYTTELLSRVVGPTGKVYSQNGPFPPQFAKVKAAYDARMKEPAMSNVVAVSKPFNASDMLPVPPGSLDAVIIHENYHDLVGHHLSPDNVNAQVFKALKPGGFYCVVDHSAANGSGDRDAATLHRIDENFEIQQIEKAGFKLAAASSALRHPEDDRTWIVFKKRGQTDRFMLKFVKPAS
ncbi:MAG TPA: hypothetical protein VMA09_02020 [Candidatus Binataceae bacterium]|nr:hypothetical protein [Candidatus Binataceae bacterium]